MRSRCVSHSQLFFVVSKWSILYFTHSVIMELITILLLLTLNNINSSINSLGWKSRLLVKNIFFQLSRRLRFVSRVSEANEGFLYLRRSKLQANWAWKSNLLYYELVQSSIKMPPHVGIQMNSGNATRKLRRHESFRSSPGTWQSIKNYVL